MARVRDKKTGKVREVADDALGEEFAGGAELEAGARVPVMVEGRAMTVPVEDLASAQQAGAQLLTAEGVAAERRRKKFATTGQQLAGAGEALLRGLTLDPVTGLATAGLEAAGVSREAQQGRQEELAEVGTALELIGGVAPVLVSGGTGGVAAGTGLAARGGAALRAAGAVPRAFAAVGRGAETLAARGLAAGLGEGAAASVLGRSAATAAGAAAEGAALGTSQVLSEAIFKDKEITAERILSNVGGAALLSAAIGGAGSAAVGATGAAVRRSLPPMQRAVKRFFGVSSLEGLANQRQFRQLTRAQRPLKEAKKLFGENLEKPGRILQADGIDLTKGSLGELAERIATLRQESGEAIGDSMRRLDNAAEDVARPNLSNIAARLRKEVIEPLKRHSVPRMQNVGKQVERQLEPYLRPLTDETGAAITSVGFSDMHRMRGQLGDFAWQNKINPTPLQAELRPAVRIIEDELLSAADKASKSLGGDIANNYRAQKDRFSVYKTYEKAADDGLIRRQQNNVFGLNDNILGGGATGGAMGAMLAADASALGALTMASLVGMGGQLLSKFVKEQGAKIVARTTRSLADMQRKDRQTQKLLNSSVRDYFDGTKRATPIVAALSLAESFEQKARTVEAFDVNALEHAAHTQFHDAPAVADQMTAKLTQANQFLREKLPPRNLNDRPADDRGSMPSTPASAMSRFLRYARVAEDPGAAIRDFQEGQLTREGAEALRQVWPHMHAQLAERARAEMTERKGELTRQQQIQLTVLLGEPVSYSLEPGYIQAAQAVHARNKQPARPKPRRTGPSQQPESLETEVQQLKAS